MRALGIDLGSKRIGVATSDRSGTIATPLTVLQRQGSREADYRAIADLVAEYEIECVVVGLPLHMNGTHGDAAKSAVAEVQQLTSVLSVPVLTYDERRTTVTADQVLMQQNMNAQERRKVIDKVAAAVMLQSWLDGRKMTEAPTRD
ncbi:MAG: Holliday junction resolvase RuvX [Actinomycetota bacterium]